MTTIFITAALIQHTFGDNTDTISNGTYLGITVFIAVISSILNLLCINRLFHIYVLNVKGAFRVHYGHSFLPASLLGDQAAPLTTQEREDFAQAEAALEEELEHPIIED